MTQRDSGRPVLHDYEVERLSLEAAVFRVYEGRHRYAGQPVAIQLLVPEVARGAGIAERLSAAARRAAQLRHPAIVATYDVVSELEDLGVVTEPGGGAWLAHLAPSGAALPTASAVVLADGLLAAVELAHAAGMAHAAICPDVVVLTPDGHVRLDGFAIGATLPAGATPSLAPGEYVAPEVRGGAPADGTADLYAAAAVAWRVLTGRPPGTGEPGNLPPPALAATLQRALDPERARRHGTATELRGALLGAAVASLGPSWRLQSDLDERVAAALGDRVVAATATARTPSGVERPAPSPFVSTPVQRKRATATAAPRPRRRRWWILGALLAVAAGAAAATIVLLSTRGSDNASGPLVVGNDVKVTVVHNSGQGCNTVYTAIATGTLHGSGTLVYHFEHGTTPSPDQTASIAGHPGFRYIAGFRLQGRRTGTDSVSFVITSPTSCRASTDFSIACP